MESSGNNENRRAGVQPRVDFILAIESVGELYTGLAPRLSTDGLYIETDQPVPSESEVGFTVTLPDGVVVMRGIGRVMWVRPPESSDDPTGMAVRFTDVDPDARETLDAVIDAHLASGGVLFDLDGGQLGGDTFPTDSLDTALAESHGPRWVREVGGPVTTTPSSGEDPTAAERDLEVGELRFEEVIAGFSNGREAVPAADDRSLDDAIAAAVGLTTDPIRRDRAPSKPDTGVSPTSAAPILPDVLDQWRRELEIAGQGPVPPHPKAEPGVDAREWESLLPFESDENVDLGAPAPWTPPDGTTTSARWDEGDNRRLGRWWMSAMAVMAVVVLGVALAIWLRESSDRTAAPAPQVTEVIGVAVAPLDESSDALSGPEVLPDSEPAGTDPVPELQPAKPASQASIVESITWQADAGQTRVLIRTDGSLDRGAVDAIRLDDPPRVLVRIRGIARPFTPNRFEVASPEISAIRVGYHPELQPAALYIVLDMTSNNVLSANALSLADRQAIVTVRTGP